MKHERDDGGEAGRAVHGSQKEPTFVAARAYDRQGERAPARDCQSDKSPHPADEDR
jgi:hypothetical protein